MPLVQKCTDNTKVPQVCCLMSRFCVSCAVLSVDCCLLSSVCGSCNLIVDSVVNVCWMSVGCYLYLLSNVYCLHVSLLTGQFGCWYQYTSGRWLKKQKCLISFCLPLCSRWGTPLGVEPRSPQQLQPPPLDWKYPVVMAGIKYRWIFVCIHNYIYIYEYMDM